MKKFEVIQYFTSSKVFHVEAESLDDALDIVNGLGGVKPVLETGKEFASEDVRTLEDNEEFLTND